MNGVVPTSSSKPASTAPFLAMFLQSVGFIDLVATPVGVLLVLALRLHNEQPLDSLFVALLVGAFISGLTLGAILVGLAAVVRHGYAMNRASDDADSRATYYTDASELDPDSGGRSLEMSRGGARQLVTTLTDLRDVQLLPESDREASCDTDTP